MDQIEFDVTCPYCGMVFRASSVPSTQVECECPHCHQLIVFDAPETGDDVLNTEDFEPESSYVVPQVPVQQSYVPSSNSMQQDYYAPPQYLEEPRRRSYFPFIIGIIALGMLLGSVAYWYFGIYQPRKLELADFNAAKRKGDVYAARNFLNKHEKDALNAHRIAMETVVRAFVADSVAWETAKMNISSGNLKKGISALEKYLSVHPKGMLRNEASSQLTKMREEARIEEAARNKTVTINMLTNGSSMSYYNCNYGAHIENTSYGTRYYLESKYIYVPTGKTWRVTDWDWSYDISRMYYPQIELDNGYIINVNRAVSEGYCIPGGHSFKIKTPTMYSSDGSYYNYSLSVSFHEDDY